MDLQFLVSQYDWDLFFLFVLSLDRYAFFLSLILCTATTRSGILRWWAFLGFMYDPPPPPESKKIKLKYMYCNVNCIFIGMYLHLGF
jgi:hypothetical protein